MRIFAITMAIGWLAAGGAMAADPGKSPAACAEVQTCGSVERCGHCGRCCACEKYCRVVCEMKEVKKTVWVVKCDEVCTLMPGCGRGCNGCGICGDCANGDSCDCGSCGKHCDPCAAENAKRFVPPKCGKVRERKTLEKKEVVCKVPSYKCVVVYACQDCGANGARPATDKPAAPSPAPAPNKAALQTSSGHVLGVSYVR